MRETQHSSSGSISQALVTLIGPRTATLVGSCVLVMTAYTLGIEWMASTMVGLPMGLWIVGLAMLFAQYRHQNGGFGLTGLEPETASRPMELPRLSLPRISLPSMRAAMPSAGTVGGMLELVGVPADSLDQAKRKLGAIGAKVAPSPGTLRIGVDLAEADARELIAYGLHEGNLGVSVEWCKARSGLITDVESDMAAGGFDVIVRRERRGDVDVFVAEHPDRPAAWPEWGTALPLGYAGVFPPRVDPSRVTLAGCEFAKESHAALAARMVIACAMLSRAPGRAGGARTGIGRVFPTRPVMPEIAASDGPLSVVMRRISHGLERVAEECGGAPVPVFARSAARVCGAYFTGNERTPGELSRVEAVAQSARICGEEPETVLRLAAVLFAEGRAEEARGALVTACGKLRLCERRCDTDPLAFIMSEVELGAAGRMTLGRVAAGIGLAWATAPRESVDYLREDLLDDLAHAGWLRDRPADVELLKSVLGALEPAGLGMRAAA